MKDKFSNSNKYILNYKIFPKYHPLHILINIFNNYFVNKAFLLSPLLLIFEECVFNDFQIRYLSYYMLFYTPIFIIYKITSYILRMETVITKALYYIYYKKEKTSGMYVASPLLNDIINRLPYE